MSETKYLYVSADLSLTDPVKSEVEDICPATRYRIEQRDGRDVLVYDPEPPPPAEAPSEPSVEEERWAFFHPSDRKLCLSHTHQGGKTVGGERLFPVIVRSKAADEALRAQLADAINSQVDATEQLEHERQSYETLVHEAVELRRQVSTLTRERDEARSVVDLKLLERGLREGIEQRARIATLIAERDDLSRKLAVAEGELTIARQEWDDQYAKFIKVATERDEYVTRLNRAQQKLAESTSERESDSALSHARRRCIKQIIRDHAPAARYPEVVEFLDAVGNGSFIIHRLPNTRCWAAGWSNGKHIESGWCDTLAAACRAALDSRKERADG